jgi:glycosyltransferase involved in cell wall biosynthesis
MKVAFNARLLYAPTLRGWNRYTVNLLAELPKLGVKLYLYSDRPIHPDHLARLPQDSYQIRLSPSMRYPVWEQYWLPQQCQSDKVDILHSPFNFGLPWFSPCPRVLTLHDAIEHVYHRKQNISNTKWYQKLDLPTLQMSMHNWIAYSQAEAIITVSNHAKADLIKYLSIAEQKISVTYEAADPNFHQPILASDRDLVRAKYNLNFPYVFYVGGWEQRKNIPFLLKAFAAAKLEGVKLVLAGGSNTQKTELLSLAIELDISESLELMGWVEEEDLPILYAEAMCFVYPSDYEGFGLQLCEAMAVGCPILAANSTCLPEILGDGGKTFNLDQTQDLSQLLVMLKNDINFREKLSRRAFQKSQEYSWKSTAMSTISVYKQL